MKIHDNKIKINAESSLQAIASTLFDEAKRQSNAINSIERLRKKAEKELAKLKDQAELDEESITVSEQRKKDWYERYRWFFTSEGLLAIGGRDSSSNSAIIRKYLEKNDRIFHADVFGSPFFILKNSSNPSSISLKEVAHATVCFSRAWKEGMYGINAYWVNPQQIKKAAPSGQFLTKGSFIVEGQRNYIKVPTLKLAVGLYVQDKNYLITCGPPEPIKKDCICYVIIEPSGSDMISTAKKIRLEFIKIQEDVKILSLDEFVRILPSGSSHIVDVGMGNLDG